MTRQEERELLRDYLATCGRLAESFAGMETRVVRLLPMSVDRIDALAPTDAIYVLAFLKSFEQFEDALHRTMKTIAQIMMFGRVERLTPRDVANKAEGFGIIADADRWADAVRTRNALAHEYPLRPDKRTLQLNRAWETGATLHATWAGIKAFVDQEGLLTS